MSISVTSLFRKNLPKFLKGEFDFLRERRGGHGHRCYLEGLSVAERDVVKTLAYGLSYKEYFIFNNLVLPLANGFSTQIDHIVVSKYGIFVIESKDYGGWIFAGKNNKVWTQTLGAKSNNKHTFQNPLRQNYGHIKTLESLLSIDKNILRNIAVFSERCEFKTPRIENVLYLSELNEYIKKQQQVVIEGEELVRIIGKISFMCQAVDISDELHISNVRKIQEQRNKTELQGG